MNTKLLPLVAACLVASSAHSAEPIANLFNDATFKGQLQLFDFQRDFDGESADRRDTSFGGLFYLRSGETNGVSFGGSFASANPIWDTDDAIYGLVGGGAPGSAKERESVNRLQEYFVSGNWYDTKITVGAQELRTPMMNPFPLRAIPFTYRGASVKNTSIDNLAITALYITDYMGWTAEEFGSVADGVKSEFARKGVVVDVEDNPMLALGFDYTLPFEQVKTKASIWHYTMEDVYNQTYFKLNMSGDLGATNWYFKPSYLKQDSQGSLNSTEAEFDTYQAGFHLGMKWNGFDATVKYVTTGEGDIVAPFGDEKVIIQQVVQSARANEDAYAAQLAYRFAPSSALKGVSAYLNYASYEVDGDASKDIDETDISVRYDMNEYVEGLSLRARHAIVNYATGDDLTDTRFYVYYKFEI
ncbi:OprD family outer membrane porin [Shewanella sp. 1_MG-2023]|uniref:OprD family outer membrane porin n=1 Tax=unclassified Shewanella TaxID=196818 RepID=UPI0026E3610B|nr:MULTISPECIES: OprD family outer membrane porin [unclassified Shewanella]MDO6612595.1 OprD family outer membrane porin [Shewanella sp. 7_MG-2023]MDO6772294.1 OprD family outer membrane porin [Shewanella sp. 2_MG-2023]MDO6795277.1 OprD family outer membrane porin [Shewanella sp. 1_MG-2023]